MSTDIYTCREIVEDSSEHVLPSFLGGRLQLRGLIDKTTNDRFGGGIDADLARALQPFRLLVGGLSDDGRPAAPMTVIGEDGIKYRVGSAGTIHPAPQAPAFKRVTDGLHIQAVFSGATVEKRMKALTSAVRTRATREGYPAPEKLVAQAVALTTHQTRPPPRMRFSADIYGASCQLATAKIACNLFSSVDTNRFLRPEFDPIRAFVRSGATVDPWPVQPVALDVRAGGLGPLDHLVAVRGGDDGATGLVVYFGLFAFLVRLGDVPLAPSWAAYRVNQIPTHGTARDRHNADADRATVFPSFEAAVAQTTEDVLALAERAVRTVGGRAVEIQHELYAASLKGSVDLSGV